MNIGDVIAQLFEVGLDILSTTLDSATNVIRAQIGDAVAQVADRKNCEWWQHAGFMSRPAIPVAGQHGAQCIGIRLNDSDVIIASRDVRGTKIAGNLKDGETCVYASSGQARQIFKADGSVTTYTAQGNAEGGASIAIQILADGSINLVSPLGAIAISSDAAQVLFGSSSGLRCDANGVTLIGKELGLNGGAVSLGANAADGVVLQTPIATQLAAITTWAGAVAGALNTLGAPIAGPTAALGVALALPNASTSVKAAQ